MRYPLNYHVQVKILKFLAKENHDLLEANQKLLFLNFCTMTKTMYFFPNNTQVFKNNIVHEMVVNHII